MDKPDILEALTELAEAKVGGPMPKCLEIAPGTEQGVIAEDPKTGIRLVLASNNWGAALSEIARRAKEEIERLRTELADVLKANGYTE